MKIGKIRMANPLCAIDIADQSTAALIGERLVLDNIQQLAGLGCQHLTDRHEAFAIFFAG